MISLANIKVGKRLALGFGTCLVLTIAISGMAWWGLSAVKKASDEAQKQSKMATTAQSMSLDVANIYLNIWHLAASSDQNLRLADQAAIEKLRESYKAKTTALKADATPTPAERDCKKIVDTIGAARDVNQKVTELAMKGNNKEATSIFSTTGCQKFAVVEQAVQEYLRLRDQRAKEAQHSMEQLQAKVYWVLGIISPGSGSRDGASSQC